MDTDWRNTLRRRRWRSRLLCALIAEVGLVFALRAPVCVLAIIAVICDQLVPFAVVDPALGATHVPLSKENKKDGSLRSVQDGARTESSKEPKENGLFQLETMRRIKNNDRTSSSDTPRHTSVLQNTKTQTEKNERPTCDENPTWRTRDL